MLRCDQYVVHELFCAIHTCLTLLQVEQLLGETKPFTEELDCHQPPMNFNTVLTGFKFDLCSWAESEQAGLSIEQRKPEKIVAAVRQILSSSYLDFHCPHGLCFYRASTTVALIAASDCKV